MLQLSTCFILYDYFFPAYKAGGPIQSLYNMAVALENEVNLRIVCSEKDHDGTLLDVVSNKWGQYKRIPVYYCAGGFYSYKKLFSHNRNNIYFINGIFSLHYNILPALFLRGRKIISTRGMLHPGGLTQKRLKKSIYLRLAKLLRLQKTCEFHATSEVERGYIQDVFGDRVKVWVVPNLPREVSYRPATGKRAGQLKIATVALISPMKNHLAVIKALSRCVGEVHYDIYGAVKDQQYWQACVEAIASLPKNIQVRYHGPIVSEYIEQVLDVCEVYIQPSKSENFGHSIYEALAKGRPVITSHFTPWEKLMEYHAGYNVTLESDDDLVAAINRFVFMDRDEFLQWSSAAAEYAKSRIAADEIKNKYIEMFTGQS